MSLNDILVHVDGTEAARRAWTLPWHLPRSMVRIS